MQFSYSNQILISRLGFGSFAEKPLMPFISTDARRRANPCSVEEEACEATYSYKHHLSLTNQVCLKLIFLIMYCYVLNMLFHSCTPSSGKIQVFCVEYLFTIANFSIYYKPYTIYYMATSCFDHVTYR